MDNKSRLFCPKCGSERQYNERFDAEYCELCNVWLEAKCGDLECNICQIRPNKPSQAD